ncbi:MAG: C-GCAxxG-C-C family protein [Lachnospirales bacterium]
MNTRVEETIKRHDKGYNCAQAVACTYADLVGLDEETLFKLTEALGAGMGGMEGTCGAVSGACVLAGLVNSTGNLETPNSKGQTYKLSREIVNEFLDKNSSVVCKELKGVTTGKVLRPCADCIKDAAKIAEEVLFSDK